MIRSSIIDRAELEHEFVQRLRARWARGARDYGDESFHRPLAATVEEILAEVEDVAGWAFVLWVSLRLRLQAIADAADSFEKTPGGRAIAAERERDALRARLAQVRDALAGAASCPTWTSLAGLVGRVAELVGREDTP